MHYASTHQQTQTQRRHHGRDNHHSSRRHGLKHQAAGRGYAAAAHALSPRNGNPLSPKNALPGSPQSLTMAPMPTTQEQQRTTDQRDSSSTPATTPEPTHTGRGPVQFKGKSYDEQVNALRPDTHPGFDVQAAMLSPNAIQKKEAGKAETEKDGKYITKEKEKYLYSQNPKKEKEIKENFRDIQWRLQVISNGFKKASISPSLQIINEKFYRTQITLGQVDGIAAGLYGNKSVNDIIAKTFAEAATNINHWHTKSQLFSGNTPGGRINQSSNDGLMAAELMAAYKIWEWSKDCCLFNLQSLVKGNWERWAHWLERISDEDWKKIQDQDGAIWEHQYIQKVISATITHQMSDLDRIVLGCFNQGTGFKIGAIQAMGYFPKDPPWQRCEPDLPENAKCSMNA